MSASNDRWVVRGSGGYEAIMAAGEGEYLPVSGDTPKLEVHWDGNDVAPGTFETYTIVDAETVAAYVAVQQAIDDVERVPSARPLAGQADGVGTATATLTVAGTNFAFDDQLIILWQIPPPEAIDYSGLIHDAGNLDLPHSAVPLSGQADGSGSATGTLSISGTNLHVHDDVGAILAPDSDAQTAILAASDVNEANIVDGYIAPTAGDPPPPDMTESVAQALDTEWTGVADEIFLPVSARPLSGQADGAGSASATLSVAGTNFDATVEQQVAAFIPPDDSADTAIANAAADGEAIPVDYAAPPADSPDEVAQTLEPEWNYAGEEIFLPISQRLLSGQADGSGTCSGTLSIAGTRFDAPDEVGPFLGPDEDRATAIAMAALANEPNNSGEIIVPGDPPPPDCPDEIAPTLSLAWSSEWALFVAIGDAEVIPVSGVAGPTGPLMPMPRAGVARFGRRFGPGTARWGGT